MVRLDIPLDVIEDDDSVRHIMLVGEQQLDVIDEDELAAAWISNGACQNFRVQSGLRIKRQEGRNDPRRG